MRSKFGIVAIATAALVAVKPWAAVHKELVGCKISFSWSIHE